MGLWQRLRERAEERDERWLEGQETSSTRTTYVTVLVGLAAVFAVSVGVLVWFHSLNLFSGSSGTDEFFRPWLTVLIEPILVLWCLITFAALLLFALIGWRRRD